MMVMVVLDSNRRMRFCSAVGNLHVKNFILSFFYFLGTMVKSLLGLLVVTTLARDGEVVFIIVADFGFEVPWIWVIAC